MKRKRNVEDSNRGELAHPIKHASSNDHKEVSFEKEDNTFFESNDGEIQFSDNEYEVEGEVALSKDVKDSVGITPFNLAKELEEGHFDENQHYIAHKVEKEEWFDEETMMNSEYLEKAKKFQLEHEMRANESKIQQKYTAKDLHKKIVEKLNTGETPTMALQRLGASGREKQKERSKGKRRQNARMRRAIKPEIKKEIEELTEYVDLLFGMGFVNIYEDDRAILETRERRL